MLWFSLGKLRDLVFFRACFQFWTRTRRGLHSHITASLCAAPLAHFLFWRNQTWRGFLGDDMRIRTPLYNRAQGHTQTSNFEPRRANPESGWLRGFAASRYPVPAPLTQVRLRTSWRRNISASRAFRPRLKRVSRRDVPEFLCGHEPDGGQAQEASGSAKRSGGEVRMHGRL